MRYGRRAFGHQRPMTPAQKATYVVESMTRHAGRTLADYGLTAESEVGKLVIQMIAGMTEQTAAQAA